MIDSSHTSSLISYFDALHGNFHLKIPMINQDEAILERTSFPFLVVTETDSLTRLIEAHFITDSGSELKKVFLFFQKDQYRLKKDELWPINNHDIENSWQQAFSFYNRGEGQFHSIITLSNQLDANGKLKPFSSLFYCKNRQIFFHPPCPQCGLPLQQCENDELLSNSGLQPYSHSLKRYLYCSSCCASDNLNFYVYELDYHDPSFLKDRLSLIKEFGHLSKFENSSTQFPCAKCQNHQECYVSDSLALLRIAPLSFYPFYMLIFEALSLNALDFLSLISGGTFEEIESQLKKNGELGRLSCLRSIKENGINETPFLFDSDERHFLEVLYLKLSFLGEVSKSHLSENTLFSHPDLRLSIDRIWIKLAEQGGLLPFFWNFRVKFIDISRRLNDSTSSPKLPSSESLSFLGLLWFYSLLSNKRQNNTMIHISLNDIVKQSLAKDISYEEFIKLCSNPVFLPVNIFWEPEGKTVKPSWLPFWEKSLYLGWLLFRTSFQFDTAWSSQEFMQQLENIRKEIKNELFYEKPVDYHQISSSENEAIHSILSKILKKWHVAIEGENKESLKDKDEESEKTVIFRAGDLKKPVKEHEEVSSETVVVSHKFEGHEQSPSPELHSKKQGGKEGAVIPETIILSPRKTDGAISGSAPESYSKKRSEEDKETIPETVILSPKKPDNEASSPLRLNQNKSDLEEKSKLLNKRNMESFEEEFLTETVIIKPRNKDHKNLNEKKD